MPPPPATWAPPPTAWCTWVVYSVLNLCSLLSLTVINKGVSFFYISVSVYYVVLYTNWWKQMESQQTKYWEVGGTKYWEVGGTKLQITWWKASESHFCSASCQLGGWNKTLIEIAGRLQKNTDACSTADCCPLLSIVDNMPQMLSQTCPTWCSRHAPDDAPGMPQMMPQTCPALYPAVPGFALVFHDLPCHRLPHTATDWPKCFCIYRLKCSTDISGW